MIKLPKKILYKYSIEEDVVNAITHAIGVLFAYFGTLYLISIASYNNQPIKLVIAIGVYGTSMLAMFLMSTLYHAIFHDTTRSIFKRLDHAAIFLMISGTYAPITVMLDSDIAYLILIIVYVLSGLGIILKIFFTGKYTKISTLIYVLLGWAAVFEINQLIAVLDSTELILLLSGGVIYTVGAIIYALSKFKYHHGVWHVMVFLAAVAHFLVIYNYIK